MLYGMAQAKPGVCERAIQAAAQRHNVPVHLMKAMTLVESGRTTNGVRSGWPWTINVHGEGHYFDTQQEAVTYARDKLAAGITLFDAGCFQVNYKWHAKGFPSLQAMFDPEMNAEYAAQFLAALYQEVGDWMTAVGYYHSRTPRHTARYQRVISQAMGQGKTTIPGYRIASQKEVQMAIRLLRPSINESMQKRHTFSGGHVVALQNLTPQTTGSVSIRILTPGKNMLGQRSEKGRIIKLDGG